MQSLKFIFPPFSNIWFSLIVKITKVKYCTIYYNYTVNNVTDAFLTMTFFSIPYYDFFFILLKYYTELFFSRHTIL